MENKKRFITSLIFNIVETLIIFLIGALIGLSVTKIIVIMLTFLIARCFFGKTYHFKTWYRCLLWSTIMLVCLFVLAKYNMVLAICFTVFTAFIMTGKANINDMYLWNNNNEPSKYQEVADFIENNKNLQEFEHRLEKFELENKIYNYRFKEHRTFKYISEKLDIPTSKVVMYLDKITFSIKIHFDI